MAQRRGTLVQEKKNGLGDILLVTRLAACRDAMDHLRVAGHELGERVSVAIEVSC